MYPDFALTGLGNFFFFEGRCPSLMILGLRPNGKIGFVAAVLCVEFFIEYFVGSFRYGFFSGTRLFTACFALSKVACTVFDMGAWWRMVKVP